MRIRRLDLLRYGHFTDRSLELPSLEADLHVVYGPNEAGKSTALAAIEDMLFGIDPRSPYNFEHDYASMRIGGVLERADSSLEIVRRKGTKDTLLGPDGLSLTVGDGTLRPYLAGADRSFFERMFSLDHVRLETGGREILKAEDEVGQMLFSAGAGISQLREQLTALASEADDLWASRKAQRRKYYQAEERLKEAEAKLRSQTLSANKWQELKRQLEAAEKTYAGTEAEYERASAESKRLGRIRRVYRFVRRKRELEGEIEVLVDVVPLPADAESILHDSQRKESEASTRIDTLTRQLDKLSKELAGLDYAEPLVLRADDVRQLHERRIEIRRGKEDLLSTDKIN